MLLPLVVKSSTTVNGPLPRDDLSVTGYIKQSSECFFTTIPSQKLHGTPALSQVPGVTFSHITPKPD